MNALNWKTIRSNDGRLAKRTRLEFQGLGEMAGGLRRATVLVGIAEQSPGGICKIVMQWKPLRGKAMNWQGEAACLDTAEYVVEEQIPIFAQQIIVANTSAPRATYDTGQGQRFCGFTSSDRV